VTALGIAVLLSGLASTEFAVIDNPKPKPPLSINNIIAFFRPIEVIILSCHVFVQLITTWVYYLTRS